MPISKTETFNNNQIRSAATRLSLLNAAIIVFARDGFNAASTRDIAETAGVNQALIKYHFGSKHGLYIAVFENICQTIKSYLGSNIETLKILSEQQDLSAQIFEAAISPIIDNTIDYFFLDGQNDIATLIIKEQQKPTEAFDILYDGFMSKILYMLEKLFSHLRPDLSKSSLKIFVITTFSQVASVRLLNTALCRFMDWQQINEKERDQLKAQIKNNIRKLIAP